MFNYFIRSMILDWGIDLCETDFFLGLIDPYNASKLYEIITLTRTRYLNLLILKSINDWFKLRSTGWIYFNDNTLTVWNCFNIRFDKWLWYLIIARTWFNNICRLQKWFSTTCTLKRCTLFSITYRLFFKILTWAQWAHCFWYLIDLSVCFNYKCH